MFILLLEEKLSVMWKDRFMHVSGFFCSVSVVLIHSDTTRNFFFL